MTLAVVVASLLLLQLTKTTAPQEEAGKFPPMRTGWLPWIGCAIQFGKEPLNFIKRTKDEVTRLLSQNNDCSMIVQLGHVFTIHAAGKYMTFITSPAHYDYYFHTPHTDFQKAVQPYTNRAGQFNSKIENCCISCS